MTEIDKLTDKINDDLRELDDLLYKRINELAKIAKQKGINDFGWKDGLPDEDDFSNGVEFEIECDCFREHQFGIILYDDFAYQTSECLCHRFSFTDRGELIATEYYDDEDDELKEDCEVYFHYTDYGNWQKTVGIIRMIEEELGLKD